MLRYTPKSTLFSLHPCISQEQKETILNFFPFFPSTLGRARHGAKKGGWFYSGKTPPCVALMKTRKTEATAWGEGLGDGARKECVWRSAVGGTADLTTRALHGTFPASGRRNAYRWVSKFFFFCWAEARQPDKAEGSPRSLPVLQKKTATLR